MPVSSYPRVTVQGTGAAQNPQNGQALMLFNAVTGKYEAATSSTFAGGGGGDATAANQTTQIGIATNLNNLVATQATLANVNNNCGNIAVNTATANGYLYNSAVAKSVATLLEDIRALLVDIKANQTNRTARVVLTDGTTDNTFNGTSVEVHKTN